MAGDVVRAVEGKISRARGTMLPSLLRLIIFGYGMSFVKYQKVGECTDTVMVAVT